MAGSLARVRAIAGRACARSEVPGQRAVRDPGWFANASGLLGGEVGAGIGTVARVLPPSRSLTVIELDARFISFLRENVPHATVLQGDALEIIRGASFDVLISNLPHAVTESLIRLLPALSFRTAVMAVSESTDLGQLSPAFFWSEVTRITGDDFAPPQPSVSRVVRVVPAR